ncbi:hypothetical protein [Frigoribacterium salinisoli]
MTTTQTMGSRLRHALGLRWFRACLGVYAIMGLVALGSWVFGYSWSWVTTAVALGGMVSSLLVFRGLWLASAPAQPLPAVPYDDDDEGDEGDDATNDLPATPAGRDVRDTSSPR